MKIFFYRHQAGGVMYGFPFKKPPTEEDLEVLRALMVSRHGEKHDKTGKPYWDRVVEVEVRESGSLKKSFEEAMARMLEEAKAKKTSPIAAMAEFMVSGTGKIE